MSQVAWFLLPTSPPLSLPFPAQRTVRLVAVQRTLNARTFVCLCVAENRAWLAGAGFPLSLAGAQHSNGCGHVIGVRGLPAAGHPRLLDYLSSGLRGEMGGGMIGMAILKIDRFSTGMTLLGSGEL